MVVVFPAGGLQFPQPLPPGMAAIGCYSLRQDAFLNQSEELPVIVHYQNPVHLQSPLSRNRSVSL